MVLNIAIFTHRERERERVEFLIFFLINVFQFFEIKKLKKKNLKWHCFSKWMTTFNRRLRFRLVGCKIFSECKIFSSVKYFQVFGCIMKIFLENVFMCLVAL